MLFLSLIALLVAGFSAAVLLLPRTHAALGAWLAAGLGAGLLSAGLFAGMLIGGRPGPGFLAVEGGLALALAAAAVRKLRGPRPSGPGMPTDRALLGAVFVTAALAAGTFLLKVRLEPHGEWDGWAIWNLRARTILRAGEAWTETFPGTPGPAHRDYPLLLPLNVVRLWSVAGSETTAAPILLALLFGASTAGLLGSSLSALRDRTQGLLGVLVLLLPPFFLHQTASQYADVPLAFFLASALALFNLYDQAPSRGLLALAGACAGWAAWTKNEGLLMVLVLAAARAAVTRRPRELIPFGLGLLPGLATVLVFKGAVAPPSMMVEGISVANLLDGSRYLKILSALASVWGDGRVAVPIVLLLALYARAVGVARPASEGVRTAALTLVLLLGGYLLVYLASPYPLEWHLASSLDRLLLHLWPSFVLLYFLVVNRVRIQGPV